jgi:2'-5' RNA ligase
MTTTVWRLFCAVELPQEVRAQLRDHVSTLRKAVPDVTASWSRVDNIHLTLKFFGNVAVDRIEAISAAVNRAVNVSAPLEIGVGKSGAFRAQVLWIGVSDPSGKLSELHKQIERECAAEGFEKEGRAYQPHLTIARIRRREGAKRLVNTHLEMNFETFPLAVNELVVFRSQLSPKGSTYTAISHHRLYG